jgi:hypothetical protein
VRVPWKGFVIGVLALTALEVTVSNTRAASAVGGLPKVVGGMLDRLINPNVPLIGTTKQATSGAVYRPQPQAQTRTVKQQYPATTVVV